MRPSHGRYRGEIVLIGVLMSLSSCQCEDDIREMISNPGNRGSMNFEDQDGSVSSNSEGPSEDEPNDTTARATALELRSNLQPVHGTIESGGDVDWYAVRADTSQTVEWTVRPQSGSLNLAVGVARSDSEEDLQLYDVAGPGEAESIPILRIQGKTPTYLAVRASHSSSEENSGAYTWTFQQRLSRGAVEAEPDDTPGTAFQFPYPGEVQGFYDRPEDRDIYHVEGSALNGGIHSLQVTATGEFPQTVEMYTSIEAESPRFSFEVPPDRRRVIPNLHIGSSFEGLWFKLSAGTNYDRDAGYRLRLIEHPPVEEASIALEGEPNDDRDAAQLVTLGTEMRGYLHRPDDVDHIDLEVGDVVDSSSERDRLPSGAAPAPDAGGIRPPKQLEPSPSDGGDSNEPNSEDSRRAEPAPLERTGRTDSEPTGLRAKLPDKSPPDHHVRVVLQPERDSDRLELMWFREDRSQPLRLTSPKQGKPVRICAHPIDQGVMSFAIRGSSLEERRIHRDFTYAIAFRDLTERDDTLELEPNDDRRRADRLEMGSTRTGHIASADDTDVYAFVIPRDESDRDSNSRMEDGLMESFREETSSSSRDRTHDSKRSASNGPSGPPTTVQLTLEGTELNLGFDILDNTGARVAEVDRRGPGAGEAMQIDLPPGLYYVRVQSEREFSCDPYHLQLQTPS